MSCEAQGQSAAEADGLDARRWATNERILVAFWPRSGKPEMLSLPQARPDEEAALPLAPPAA